MDYKFIINDFEGPLDLLLHLIKVSEVDIYDISIADVTKQYIDFIESQKSLNLNIASEYLVMAAELIEIKSKLLLPNKSELDEDEFEEDPRENLINRLVEYKKYKDMISDFKKLEEKRRDIFTKEPMDLKDYTPDFYNDDNDVSLDDLINALNKFLKRKEDEKPLQTKITKKELSVTERTNSIRNILRKKKSVSFVELFEIKTREYVVVTFLSILEMAKFGEIKIVQDNNFDNILVNLKEDKND